MPMDLSCPGLCKRESKSRLIFYWICRSDISRAGYPVKSSRIWSGPLGEEPTADEMMQIRGECFRLQSEMKQWMKDQRVGRRSKRLSGPGHIYFLRDGYKIKIGFSSVPSRRISNLQTASSRDLELIGTIPGNRHIEAFLHWQFRDSRTQGEWFDLTPELEAFIDAHVRERSKNKVPNGASNTSNATSIPH